MNYVRNFFKKRQKGYDGNLYIRFRDSKKVKKVEIPKGGRWRYVDGVIKIDNEFDVVAVISLDGVVYVSEVPIT